MKLYRNMFLLATPLNVSVFTGPIKALILINLKILKIMGFFISLLGPE